MDQVNHHDPERPDIKLKVKCTAVAFVFVWRDDVVLRRQSMGDVFTLHAGENNSYDE